MSFADMFKKSIIEGFSTDISIGKAVASLFAAFLAAMFILVVYRITVKKLTSNRGYEITLLLVTVISAMIVLTITSNLALSLGMVGALSIVRFRTAIKDAFDTAFMFWSVAAGITAGAGFYMITVVGCLFIGLVAVVARIVSGSGSRPYLLVIRIEGEAEYRIEQVLEAKKAKYKLSSIIQSDGYTEIIYELGMSSARQSVVSSVKAVSGVRSVTLVDCRN